MPDPTIYERYVSRDFAMLLTILTILVTAHGDHWWARPRPSSPSAGLRPDFYNTTNSPLALILAIVLSACPLLAWRGSEPDRLARAWRCRLSWAWSARLWPWSLGRRTRWLWRWSPLAASPLPPTSLMIVRIYKAGIWKLGGYLAHVGVGLILVGIVGSAAYSQTEQLRLEEGKSGQALGYTFTFNGLQRDRGDRQGHPEPLRQARRREFCCRARDAVEP